MNFRIGAANQKWLKQRAAADGHTASTFLDLLVTRARESDGAK